MQLPREVIVGKGTINLVGEICRKLGFKESALVVTGPKTHRIAAEKVVDVLKDVKIKVECYVVESCITKELELVEKKIEDIKPEVVLGVGGGTKIDVAKFTSSHKSIPFISIPTTVSHDGIASSLVSLKGLNKPYSVIGQSPMAIIADTEIIIQSPYRFTASGCGDIIAKFTAVKDWELAHKVKKEYYGDYAANLALMSATLVKKNAKLIKPHNEEGLRIVLEALISCGVAMSIAGSSRPCSGSEHLFSHALDLVAPKPALHGEQCGVGTIMMAYLHGINWKHIEATLREIGAPTNAEELQIEPKYIIEALVKAGSLRPERYTILNQKKLNYDSAKKLAKEVKVIN
jgi:glycerol-1-phosphate dehydrogenase [NAD(P)+]